MIKNFSKYTVFIFLSTVVIFLSSCATAKKAEIKPAVTAEKKGLEEKKIRISIQMHIITLF